MMNSSKPSGSNPMHLPQTKPNTSSASNQLTPSEIERLRQSKKSIADYVQKELANGLKKRKLSHLLK